MRVEQVMGNNHTLLRHEGEGGEGELHNSEAINQFLLLLSQAMMVSNYKKGVFRDSHLPRINSVFLEIHYRVALAQLRKQVFKLLLPH